MPTTVTYVANLPAGLLPFRCSAPFGSCVFGAGPVSPSGGVAINRKQSVFSTSSMTTITWTGTIPVNGSVTIRYEVQVSALATNGTNYQITSTIDGAPGPTSTIRVNAPPAGPGDQLGLLGAGAAQKAGSVLIYNLYTSGVNVNTNDTRIVITNTNQTRRSNVHLFFVDGATCSVADMTLTLTQNQTVSLQASDFDPGVTGYLIAVAVDESGCPTISNDLIGESLIKFESGHRAALPALAISGLVGNGCDPGLPTAVINFDGIAYNQLPRVLAVDSLSSLVSGSTMLVVNRIGGDLSEGGSRLGTMSGLLFDDAETSQSFTLPGGSCQTRGVIGNNYPRTAPRYTAVVPAGRTGWMKFGAVEDQAITGAVILGGGSDFSGGHNLHILTTTGSASLTIPVVPVG